MSTGWHFFGNYDIYYTRYSQCGPRLFLTSFSTSEQRRPSPKYCRDRATSDLLSGPTYKLQ